LENVFPELPKEEAMIAKVWPNGMLRTKRGRLAKTISDGDARRILADYKRTGSIVKTGDLHDRAGATIYGLLRRRGLIKSRRPTEQKIRQMYREYCDGLSLGEVGKKYGRTRQAVFDLFKVRGFELRHKKFQTAVVYRGRKFTPAKSGYLRETVGRTEPVYLHHLVWEEDNGPIPPGHKVCFRDGDRLNCSSNNLMLLTNDEQQQWRGRKGVNQFTKTAGDRLKLLVGNFESGSGTLSTALKARAA
jgi:hypothetical protein